eukprot:1059976-Prymnesium_polylepis.2
MVNSTGLDARGRSRHGHEVPSPLKPHERSTDSQLTEHLDQFRPTSTHQMRRSPPRLAPTAADVVCRR